MRLQEEQSQRRVHRFDQIKVARTFKDRLQGLLNFERHPPNMVFVIPRCKIVHTFGMAYPIDVIFVSRSLHIVHICERVGPRVIVHALEAIHTLELEAGAAAFHQLRVGDRLCSEQFMTV